VFLDKTIKPRITIAPVDAVSVRLLFKFGCRATNTPSRGSRQGNLAYPDIRGVRCRKPQQSRFVSQLEIANQSLDATSIPHLCSSDNPFKNHRLTSNLRRRTLPRLTAHVIPILKRQHLLRHSLRRNLAVAFFHLNANGSDSVVLADSQGCTAT